MASKRLVLITLVVLTAFAEWTSQLQIGWILLAGFGLFLCKREEEANSEKMHSSHHCPYRPFRPVSIVPDLPESLLDAVFDLSSDYLSIYQELTVQKYSRSMMSLFTGSSPETYWQTHLSEAGFNDFMTAVSAAASGNSQSLTLHVFSSSPDHILPLSPVLESLPGRQASSKKLEVVCRRVNWKGKLAVLVRARPYLSDSIAMEFAKTMNHEFRTPLNIIIGLSDLILADCVDAVNCQRLRLVRQCASTFLAVISSLVHQCELMWKLPRRLSYTNFSPTRVIRIALSSVKEQISARGNNVELFESNFPDVVWGNPSQFRLTFAFVLKTCSEFMENEEITVNIAGTEGNGKYEFQGEITAERIVKGLNTRFQSVLQLFHVPFDNGVAKSDEWIDRLRQAEAQALIQFSIAREMCQLLFGDLQLKATETGTFQLTFSFQFSTEKNFLLKRKGGIFPDPEEHVQITPGCSQFEIDQETLLSDTPESEASFECKGPKEQRPESGVLPRVRSQNQIPVNAGFAFWSQVATQRRHYTLPVKDSQTLQVHPNPGDQTPALDLSHPPLSSLVLIAEDVPSNAMVLQEMLKRLNISSAVVPNGAEAVEYVQNFIPDAIFMDCEMPVLNGLEATRIIRNMKIAIPIVAVTANGPEKERECVAAGMTYFLNKPVAFRTLELLMKRLHIGETAVD